MTADLLFICGSLNQTTIMHQIARQMPGENCFFTPFYATGPLGLASQAGLANFSILGGAHRRNTEAYLARENLPVDFGGRARSYDAILTCTDLHIQNNVRGRRLVLVQEGMTDPEGLIYRLVRRFKLPRFLANTAATGLSDAYDAFCVASAGYRNLFIKKGVNPDKIKVTGIPNFDHVESFLHNDFPHHGYVLVATSSLRETGKWEDRAAFIRQAWQIAAGRQLIFKLHPNENVARARREIQADAPGALVYTAGNTNHMIANCDVLITQYSTVTFIGLALHKEVHSLLDLEALRRLAPLQNGGSSSLRIAEVCQQVLKSPHRTGAQTARERWSSWRRKIFDAA